MIDPGDRDQIRSVLEELLRERDQTQDIKAKRRTDADAYIREISRRDPGPNVPPVTFTDTVLPIERFDFFSDPAQGAAGSSSTPAGTVPDYPGADGVYADKWSDGGATYVKVKLDEVEVDDCSSGTTVTRKFLALPP